MRQIFFPPSPPSQKQTNKREKGRGRGCARCNNLSISSFIKINNKKKTEQKNKTGAAAAAAAALVEIKFPPFFFFHHLRRAEARHHGIGALRSRLRPSCETFQSAAITLLKSHSGGSVLFFFPHVCGDEKAAIVPTITFIINHL